MSRHNDKRTYRHPRGGKVVIRKDGRCYAMPAWCEHIHKIITRDEAADLLRTIRKARRAA